MVALDDGEAAPGPQHAPQLGQGRFGPRQVLQHEAREGVVEGAVREGQGLEVRPSEPRHGKPRRQHARLRLVQGGGGNVHVGLLLVRSQSAPTPQPASRTVLPAGNAVSWWSSASSVDAWSCSRRLSAAS